MNSARLARQVTLMIGGSAIVAMGVLAGCSSTTKEEPKTTSTPSSAPASAPEVSPTEKKVGGPGGPSSFSPTVKPVIPGDVCTHTSNGVCQR